MMPSTGACRTILRFLYCVTGWRDIACRHIPQDYIGEAVHLPARLLLRALGLLQLVGEDVVTAACNRLLHLLWRRVRVHHADLPRHAVAQELLAWSAWSLIL